jgi:hypothetical protein
MPLIACPTTTSMMQIPRAASNQAIRLGAGGFLSIVTADDAAGETGSVILDDSLIILNVCSLLLNNCYELNRLRRLTMQVNTNG